MSRALRIIPQARLKPKPATPSSSSWSPCPTGWIGSGQYYSRNVTWDVTNQVWVIGNWYQTNFDCKLPPPPDTDTTRTLACPAGQSGSGIKQERTATWVPDGENGHWEFGEWTTVSTDCRPVQTYSFTTANSTPSPNYTGGNPGPAGKAQYYSGSGSSGPYSMSLSLKVVSDGSMMWSELSISCSGPNIAGAAISVYWDRAYSSFPSKTLDSSGSAFWRVSNWQWTGHGTSFTVTITV